MEGINEGTGMERRYNENEGQEMKLRRHGEQRKDEVKDQRRGNGNEK